MKKKIFAVVLMLLLVFGNCMSVSAAGVPDTQEPVEGVTTVTLTNLETGESYEVDMQDAKVVTTVCEDGSVFEQVVVEVDIPGETQSEIAPRASVTDGGSTTRITLNINYTKSGNLYRITGVTGQFERLDTAFTISNRHVRYANYHDNQSSGGIKDYKPTGNTFSYPGFSNWVDSTSIQYIVGGYAECDITRSSSTWNLCCRHIIIERDLNAL